LQFGYVLSLDPRWRFCDSLLLNKRCKFGDQESLNNRFAIWLYLIARSSLAILRQPIAKQAMAIWRSPIAKKSESDLGKILSLSLCWRLGEEQSLSVRELLLLSLNKQCFLAITSR
jgi:hypothetical protein